MKTILREPLLHFLLLGAALFVVYDFVSKRTSDEPGKIVVTQAQIATMAEGFTRTWRRPPMREELEGLVRDRVQEEIFFREAMALGLDKDDTIIRRRLRQKMEFVSEDIVAQAQPSDDELNAYLLTHSDSFRVQQTFSFKQIYFDPARHADKLAHDTASLIAQLNRPGNETDIATLGDPLMLEQSFTALPRGEVEKLFGDKFAKKLAELAPGQWQGPIESGYGTHLVLVEERAQGKMPALAEVRDAVIGEWTNSRRQEANEKFFQELLKHYTVTIEPAPPVEESKKLAGMQ